MRQSHLIHTPTTIPPLAHRFSIPHPIIPLNCSFSKIHQKEPSSSQLITLPPKKMASANSSVLSMISSATAATANAKLPVVKVQQVRVPETKQAVVEGRRAALLGLAAVALTATAITPSAKAGVIEEYLEKSKANKELNDKKRLATSGANFARAYTVEFGTCKFPYNFTGCQDLAKQKKVPFISDDLEIECEGKEKFKCGSNVFWKW